MDKIILVSYIGMKNGFANEYIRLTNEIKSNISNLTEKADLTIGILTDYDLTFYTIRLECLNPRDINKSVYDLLQNKLISIEKIIQDKLIKIND